MSRDVYVYQDQLFAVIHEYLYTGEPEEFTLEPGKYLLMCYGARGGHKYYSDGVDRSNEKPHGGFSAGILDLANTTTMYAVVGGDGSTPTSDFYTPAPGGYNGGGRGGISTYPRSRCGGPGGGGGTDIRLSDELDSVYEDISVTLPDDYTAIEYLDAVNDQYLDTGYYVNSMTTIECEFYSDSTNGGNSNMTLFSCDNMLGTADAANYWYAYGFMVRSGSTWRYRFNAPTCQQTSITTSSTDPALFNTRVILTMGETGAYWHAYGSDTVYYSQNDSQITFTCLDFDDPDRPMPTIGIFGAHRATGTGEPFWANPCINVKIYSFTIREDNTDIHKFIPVIRSSDSATGLYDIITNNFIPYAQSVVAQTLETRTFTYRVYPHRGYNSRIIVAGGAGGGTTWTAGAKVNKRYETGAGGGVYGGYPFANSGFNLRHYPTQQHGAHFGRGQDSLYKYAAGSLDSSINGDGGGGGGWYGGYSNIGTTAKEYTEANGGGGSGYVLTSDSYKPDGYMADYNISDFYMTYPFMVSGRSEVSKVIVARAIDAIMEGDVIHAFCDARMEKVTLPPGSYLLECNGASGNARRINYESTGGRATGVLTTLETHDVFMVVGDSPTTVASNNVSSYYVEARYPTFGYNGGGATLTTTFSNCATASGGGTDIRLLKPESNIQLKKIPVGYTELTSVTNDIGDNNYIDTGYMPTAKTRIECKANIMKSDHTTQTALFSSRVAALNTELGFWTRFSDKYIPCFCINNKEYELTGLVYDEDITIIIDGSTVAWYDETGDYINGAYYTTARVDCAYNMFIFENDHSGSPTGEYTNATIYNFICSNDGIHTLYLLPCMRDSDGMVGMYDLVSDTFIPAVIRSGTGLTPGDIIPEADKTVVEIRTAISNEQSLLSRIIVGGGGGGAGGSDDNPSTGGSGGGLEGTRAIAGGTSGTNPGPGTQIGSPHTGSRSEVWGDFGYGGRELTDNSYGGAGGGGWYGGSGTVPSGTNSLGGSGGSGYVLTETSYKPTGYIPDERFYLTNTTLVTGGAIGYKCDPSATITVLDINNSKILVRDNQGLKYLNDGTWVTDPHITLDTESFELYGTNIFNTENGLNKPYTIYINDEEDIVDSATITNVPNTISLKTRVHADNNIIDVATIDMDMDDNITYNVTTELLDDGTYDVVCSFDMLRKPTMEYNLYNIFTTSSHSADGGAHPPIRPYKHLDHIDLMRVGEDDIIPNRYNDYMSATLLDGTVITDIYYSATIEYNRELYTLMNVNGGILRLIKYTLISKTYSVIFEIPKTSLDIDYSGSTIYVGRFLVDRTYCYITAKNGKTTMTRIRLSDPTDISTINVLSTNVTARGKMYWLSEDEFIIPALKGYSIYNTTLQAVSSNLVYTSDWKGYDWIVTDKYFIRGTSGNTSNMLVYDRQTYTWSTKSQYGYGWKSFCKDDKYIYAGQQVSGGSAVIEILDIDTLDRVRVVTLPSANAPMTMEIANDVIYYTIKDNSRVFICKLKGEGLDEFREIRHQYQFKEQYTDNSTNWQMQPCVFRSYYFAPYFRLFTINWSDSSKYNLGYKHERAVYQTTLSEESSYTYDPRYMTFYDSHVNIHMGEIDIPVTTYSGTIKQCTNNLDYRTFISVTLNKRE